MQYKNSREPRVPQDLQVPNKPGFYWAKWQICEDGTDDEENWKPSGEWIVVKVEIALLDKDRDLDVTVLGEPVYQSLENFIWYKPIKPLEPPQ